MAVVGPVCGPYLTGRQVRLRDLCLSFILNISFVCVIVILVSVSVIGASVASSGYLA